MEKCDKMVLGGSNKLPCRSDMRSAGGGVGSQKGDLRNSCAEVGRPDDRQRSRSPTTALIGGSAPQHPHQAITGKPELLETPADSHRGARRAVLRRYRRGRAAKSVHCWE